MTENFLHFVWRRRRFDLENLQTTDGQPLEILSAGEPNSDAGPDFFDARLRIGGQFWAGNVEIHVFSKDWAAHGHSADRAYDSVVLHVVLEENAPIFRASTGERLPTLELKNRVEKGLFEKCERLLAAEKGAFAACEKSLAAVPHPVRLNFSDRLLVERLEQKAANFEAQLEATGGDWEQVFFQNVARSLGLTVNAEPMETLAKSLRINQLWKHRHCPEQIEAMLFGAAGFLERDENRADEWPQKLEREWHFLKHKYGLESQKKEVWKFHRLRPASFPTLRIAQLAWLAAHGEHLFSKVLEAKSLREIEHFLAAETSDYWAEHYDFGKKSARKGASLSRDRIHLIAANVAAPMLFLRSKIRGPESLAARAMQLLESLPAEKNSIVEGFERIGWPCRDGFQSQALVHLHKNFCSQKKCLDCAIGAHLLK